MRIFPRWLLLLIGLMSCCATVSQSRAQEESVRPGINSSYEQRSIEQSVEIFEGESREIFRFREKIVDVCGLKSSMVVADIGAGTGLFTRLFAPKVADGGKVYAVDITRKFVAHIEKTCKDNQIDNVECVVCTPTSTELPSNSIDLAFTCDVYHHFEYPVKTLASIRNALRDDGRLIVIDFEKEEGLSPEWVMGHVRADKQTVIKEVTDAGFELVDEVDLMKGQYVLRFEKASVDGTAVSPGNGNDAAARED